MSWQAISSRELRQLDVVAQQGTSAPARKLRSGTSIKPVATEAHQQVSTNSETRGSSLSVQV